jgi:sugar phosphate isomerase/epimerase
MRMKRIAFERFRQAIKQIAGRISLTPRFNGVGTGRLVIGNVSTVFGAVWKLLKQLSSLLDATATSLKRGVNERCRQVLAGGIGKKCGFIGFFLLLCHTAFAANPPAPAFFAFDNGTRDEQHKTLESQAALLKELGYDGISWRPAETASMLKALDAQGLKMFAIYTVPDFGEGRRTYDPQLKTAIQALKGRDTIIWMGLTSKSFKPSATNGDAEAAGLINEVADWAKDSGLRLALYPHVGFYEQSVTDCVRLAGLVNRTNVGVSFNLCHSLKLGEGPRMKELLGQAAPRLFLVSINGADADGKDWNTLIQTLDKGSLDVLPLLKALRELNYSGAVGLQCYNIKGEVKDNLSRSMAAWQKYLVRLKP